MKAQRIVSVIRRSAATQGLDGVPWPRERECVAQMQRAWDEWFGSGSYTEFRRFLYEISGATTAVTRVTSLDEAKAEWIAFIDDDDWLFASVHDLIQDVPDDVMLVAWPVEIAVLTSELRREVEPVTVRRGPHSCGYAVRRRFLDKLTPEQLDLVRDDHRHVHRYVHFSGFRYLFRELVGACYILSPASITVAISEIPFEKRFALPDAYQRCAENWPHPLNAIARRLVELSARVHGSQG
ncbi:hypothetical protein [Thermogutta sp.]|jgi:glycosyltransferase involved in cell wall biosynthesis|uniref:hypothetical protein n=1 Tax=Thermogutta sp. TaxID=1962930 RepID=UPI0032200286